jgi:hypothetical protein
MRHFIRSSFHSTLILALLLTACDSADTGTSGVEPDLVGDWQATLTRADSAGTPLNARYVLELGSDNKYVFELFWNGKYFMGFEGGWALKGDNVELTAIRCYKGDSSGVQTLIDCSDSMAIPTRNVRWDGRNITILSDNATLVFQKIVNAMAAKAE